MARGLRSKNALMLGCMIFFLAGMLLAITSPATRSAVGKGLGASAPIVSAPAVSDPGWRSWLRGSGIKVSAVVFYGKALNLLSLLPFRPPWQGLQIMLSSEPGRFCCYVSFSLVAGRRKYVRVLDKYLKQNLASSGGLLEEVYRLHCSAPACFLPRLCICACQMIRMAVIGAMQGC